MRGKTDAGDFFYEFKTPLIKQSQKNKEDAIFYFFFKLLYLWVEVAVAWVA